MKEKSSFKATKKIKPVIYTRNQYGLQYINIASIDKLNAPEPGVLVGAAVFQKTIRLILLLTYEGKSEINTIRDDLKVYIIDKPE